MQTATCRAAVKCDFTGSVGITAILATVNATVHDALNNAPETVFLPSASAMLQLAARSLPRAPRLCLYTMLLHSSDQCL